jgi:hypothetical protein
LRELVEAVIASNPPTNTTSGRAFLICRFLPVEMGGDPLKAVPHVRPNRTRGPDLRDGSHDCGGWPPESLEVADGGHSDGGSSMADVGEFAGVIAETVWGETTNARRNRTALPGACPGAGRSG